MSLTTLNTLLVCYGSNMGNMDLKQNKDIKKLRLLL